MTATLVIDVLAQTSVCAGTSLALLWLLPRRSAAERSWIGHVGLVATLLAPLVGMVLPRWYVVPGAPVMASPMVSAQAVVAAPALGTAVPAPAIDLDALMLVAWALPALLLMIATCLAVARLFRLRRRAAVITEASWLSALAHAQRRMDFKNGAALLVSRDFASPVSWGIVRPTIVINEEALGAGVDAEAIIAHELAHIARLDWLKLLLSRIVTAVFWFNPLVWVLAKACHQLREEAADDAVLLSDVRGVDYAALLVGAARHDHNGLLLAANGVAPSQSSLSRRVTRVLDGAAWRTPPSFAWAVVCVTAGLAIGTPLGMITAAPAPLALDDKSADRMPLASSAGQGAPAAPAPSPSAHPIKAAPANSAYRTVPDAVAAPQPVVIAAPAPLAPPSPPSSRHDWAALLANGIAEEDVAEWAAISPSYGRFGVGEMVALQSNGISAHWLRDMAALGYRDLTFSTLLQLAAQDAGPAFVREMQSVGYPKLTPRQLIEMRIQGVSAKFVRRLAARGINRASPDQLVRYAILGMPSDHPPGASPGHSFHSN